MTKVLLTADDRTGSLEIGGLVANERFAVPVGPHATSELACVVDIGSRHLTVAQAQEKMALTLKISAEYRAHKMDAGLRGNWAQEIEVLLREGYKVAVICAFPDAGRRCKDGIVYIHDLPVLESVFGKDPLNPQVSSKPSEILEHFGVGGDVVVWDANDNREMLDAIQRAVAEDRIVVGASGAIGMYANLFLNPGKPREVVLPKPILVVCGSLNPLSREQLARTGLPLHDIDSVALSSDRNAVIVATEERIGRIPDDEALQTATQLADVTRAVWNDFASLIAIGGDTAGALIGDETVETLGCVAPGIPVSRYEEKLLVTKGGGIGQPDTIVSLVA
ncbi:MAG: hypothetical protein GKR90_01240 [Pseudomonadales bacterium]|nr:hypothetical protein [Pseudomonadales bacterium]